MPYRLCPAAARGVAAHNGCQKMPFDPQVAHLIADLGPSPFKRGTLAEMRAAYQEQRLPLQPPRPNIGGVEAHDIA